MTDMAVASGTSIFLGFLPMAEQGWALDVRGWLMGTPETKVLTDEGYSVLFGASMTLGVSFSLIALRLTQRRDFGWKVHTSEHQTFTPASIEPSPHMLP